MSFHWVALPIVLQPQKDDKCINKESVELTFVYLIEGCGKT